MIHKTKSLVALAGLLFVPQLQAQVHFVTLPEGFEPDLISSDGRVAYGHLMDGPSHYFLAEWSLEAGLQTLAPSMPLNPGLYWSEFLQMSDDGTTVTLRPGDMNGVLNSRAYFYNSVSGFTPLEGMPHSDGSLSGVATVGALSGDGSTAYGSVYKYVWPSIQHWTVRWIHPGTPEAFCGEWPNDCGLHIFGANYDGSVIVGTETYGTHHVDLNGVTTPVPLFGSVRKASGDANTVFSNSYGSPDGQMWNLSTGVANLGRPPLTSSVRPIAVNQDGSVSFWLADDVAYRWTQGGGWQSMEEYLIGLGALSLAAGDFQLTEVLAYGATGKTAVAKVCRTGTSECQTVVIFMEVDIPGTLGSSYCGPMPSNSTGAASSLRATGSVSLANNDLVLEAGQLPPHQFGILLNSLGQDYMPFFASSAGTLCLGGLHSITRHNRAQDIAFSSASGSFAIPIDTSALPGPGGHVVVQSGSTYHFQVWHRDRTANVSTTNFTNAVSVLFQ